MFKEKVYQYITEKQLFQPADKVLVALSGGADSVALLRVLLELGFSCQAVHCNFCLRNDESDRDEEFVRALCRERQVNLEVRHFDTEGYANTHRISIEMAARELRYAWFEEMRCRMGCDVIAVAHHRNDSAETLILNLLRGTGIRGLKGISPDNGTVVRPLLGVDRDEIRRYLAELKQAYVTDSTNLQDEYMRNKIRLNIFPKFQEINPSFVESLLETSERLTQVEAVYRKGIDEGLKRVLKDGRQMAIGALLQEVSPQALLYEWLHPFGFNASQLKDIFQGLNGPCGRWYQTAEWRLLRDRELLILSSKEAADIHYRLVTERFPVEGPFSVPHVPDKAYLDADKVTAQLSLRKWQSGDRFIPYGMKHFKRVRDYLRDRKFTRFEKEEQYVVTAGDTIVWLVNERTDHRFRVTEQTRNVLVLSVEKHV